ncbi:3-deoxy-7-phosphoheptulonate synthase [Candidatus Viridilinea mediisalina]|uniref:3-deoxy-7-phosphoheptulonate synthase n=1 Tax=Candidatus Viridilinea mediisalina TaxID=2024553 RepID=A0A2A6RI15_9CHLR|nr:3-deoxy-7-phosphoheptulonate synthase [Candidatus Viridilinea mediisalina]
MIVVMQAGSEEQLIDAVLERLEEHNLRGHLVRGEERTVIGVVGAAIPPTLKEELAHFTGVQETLRITQPYKLVSRELRTQDTVVDVRGIKVGAGNCVVIAGPCSVESEEQIMKTAHAVREAGATMLRGGAFKPRSSPYTFRGMGETGLQLLAQAREETGLPIVTEVMTPNDVDLVTRYADVLQIGARNMQNYQLLEEVGRTGMPVLLKRGLSATIEEWLLSAEYVAAQGNPNVILCERGIRTFETATRNTLDLNAVALAKRRTHLPVLVDPSHGTGKWYLVPNLTLAGIAAGADGIIIEVHPDPDRARSDGAQSLSCENFAALMPKIVAVVNAVGRKM